MIDTTKIYKNVNAGNVTLKTYSNTGESLNITENSDNIDVRGYDIVNVNIAPGPIQETLYIVRVIDYDGIVIDEQYLPNNTVYVLPNIPDHTADGLTFVEWSANQPIAQDINNNTYYTTVNKSNIIIGPIYSTTSGLNEFDIEISKSMLNRESSTYYLDFKMSGNADYVVDWGDGTSDSSTGHTYQNIGKYTIKCNGTTLISSARADIFENSWCCVAARLSSRISTISEYAFFNQRNLKYITLPNTISSISTHAFYGSASLKALIIPNGVSRTNTYTFRGCLSLDTAVLPSSMTYIDSYTFESCDNLLYIGIPYRLSQVANYAFNLCKSLANIQLPETLTSIGSYSFNNCYGFSSINIPSNLTTIGYAAFNYCVNLSIVIFDKNEYQMSTIIDIGHLSFVHCNIKDITIPSSVTSIGVSAFNSCLCMRRIVLSSGITTIQDNTFQYCTSLQEITFDDQNNLQYIGANAFAACTNVLIYDFSKTTQVPTLADINAFTDINALAKIIVPHNLYDSWKIANNWAHYADYIYDEQDVFV